MKRLQKLKELLKEENLNGIIISSMINITYFSGFSGSVALMLYLKNRTFLIVDGRYTDQAKKEAKNCRIVEAGLGNSLWNECTKLIKEMKLKKIGFEDNKIDVETYNKALKGSKGVTFIPIGKRLDLMRIIKDSEEVKLVRESARICTLVYDCIKRIIKVGMTELEIASEIDYLMTTMKAESRSFDTLVSSGINTMYPHGKPTNKPIEKGDIIQLDFGAKYKGYCSDISRVLVAVNAIDKQKKIHRHVLDAQLAAIKKIRAGIDAKDVDEAARNVMKKSGMIKYFNHGTGHGVGLAIHEAPRISIGSKDLLKKGMVFTVEPGIYIPGWGGMRIEDMVLVTNTGCEILTDTGRELEVFS